MSTFSALRDLPSYLILPFTLLHKGEIFEVGALSEQHSMEFQTPVRVVRGHANKLSYTGKLYTYDGIYQVYDHWTEKGISGFRVFKYKLRRLPGQPDLTTQQVFFARGKLIDSAAELEGLVQNSTLIHNIGLTTLDIALIQQHFSSYIVGTLLHAKFCNS
jgi:hypothetical protein